MAHHADKKHKMEVYLVASGDLRESANKTCWPAQRDAEEKLGAALAKLGVVVHRAHKYDEKRGHGFIRSQREGMDAFKNVPKDAHLIICEAVWQYSYHVLPGVYEHKGPIGVFANWSAEWPGLVGALNINGMLTKIGKPYSMLWSVDFTDEYFMGKLKEWIETGRCSHDMSHVHDLDLKKLPAADVKLGASLAATLKENKAIMGIFDEGCMGMHGAIFEDEHLHPFGLYKERMSQSALVAAMRRVTDDEARAVRKWIDAKGMRFHTGPNPKTDLTDDQIHEQCKMYIAAARIADEFSCDLIGIQYQQGLKDMAPASDLVEGLLNNVDRPPAFDDHGKELFAGKPIVHFNEVDQGAGVDALVTNRVWTALGLDPATTLHDVRWGESFPVNGKHEFVWLFEISGAVPPSHIIGGYQGCVGERQPPVYFPLGGSTIKGVSKPGAVVWSRVFLMDGKLHADIGLATAIELPKEETERRWQLSTPQWPVMHAILHGVSQTQFMGRHRANHIQVAYGNDEASAHKAMCTKAAMFNAMGITVHVCGDVSVHAHH